MTTQEKQALVRRLQEGRRRAKRLRPQRLERVEKRMDELGVEYREAEAGRRGEIRRELRELGRERMRLRYGAE